MTHQTLLTGNVLLCTNDPFVDAEGVSIAADHGVLIENGRIVATGAADRLRNQAPHAHEHAYGARLIMPGFVDAHAHYPQTAMIASWGKRLIDWLNTYTFPEEAKFSNHAYAADVAARYLDLVLANGTTTVASYTTIHAGSVDAFFEAAAARNMRVVAGKTCMDRNAPDDLRDSAQSAYDDSKALIGKWHGRGRAHYAITPRFSPTSTPDQLAALGALWAENPNCLMQTHLSEQHDEIAWVSELFPNARDYLDTYEAPGLLGTRGVYGHATHLTPRGCARV